MECAKSLHEVVGWEPISRIWWQKLDLFFQCPVARVVGMISTFYVADVEESQTTIVRAEVQREDQDTRICCG